MATAAAFVEVLDAYVDRFGSGDPGAARRWHSGIATRPVFSFTATADACLRPSRFGAASRWPGTDCAPEPQLRLVGPPPPTPRPTRTLMPRQQDALDQFIALGARIGADFTREELRSAFRSLARAYHPDRHPGMQASEKARLSSKFALVRGAYELLRRLP